MLAFVLVTETLADHAVQAVEIFGQILLQQSQAVGLLGAGAGRVEAGDQLVQPVQLIGQTQLQAFPGQLGVGVGQLRSLGDDAFALLAKAARRFDAGQPLAGDLDKAAAEQP